MNNGIKINSLKQTRKKGPVIKAEDDHTEGFWNILNKDIHVFGKIIPDRIKEGFYAELSTLLEAGVNIKTALEIIRDEQEKKRFKALFDTIVRKIVAGSTFSTTLKDIPGFTPYEFFSIKIGEEAGQLVRVLSEMATFFNNKIKQKRQIISAITYPIIVLSIAFLAVSFMLSFVVPMFSDIFKRFGGELPAITVLVLKISYLLKDLFWAFSLLVTSCVFFCFNQRRKSWFRNYSSKFILRIPMIGKIVQKVYLARFTNTMALLIGSKIPILQALGLAKQMVNFYPIEESIAIISADVLAGITLHMSMSKHKIFPSKLTSLIKVGEEVNQMEAFFSKASKQYTVEVEYQTNLLSKFIEPVIIVLLGLIVGVILIAMYLPLFKLGQNI